MAVDRRIVDRRPSFGSLSQEKGGAQAQALGRCCSGLGTRIHAVFDAISLSVRLILGFGQRHYITPTCDIRGWPPDTGQQIAPQLPTACTT